MGVRGLVQGALVGLIVALVLAAPALADAPDESVGVVDQSTGIWYLRDAVSGDTTSFYFGDPGDSPMMGDWDCDGIDTPGLYRQSDGYVYLRNLNTQGIADIRFFFGNPGDVPLAGDFDGDGCDTVSIYRPAQARIFVINELGSNDGGLGAADFDFYFGDVGDKPFTADFNANGIDTVGLHRESTGFVYYRNTLTTGVANRSFFFGDPGDQILAGNWAQNPSTGPDTVGVFRPSQGQFYLQFTNTQGIADVDFQYGNQRMVAVQGSFGVLPGGDAAPTPAWIEPYKPPPAPYGLAVTEAAAAGTSCYDAAAKALYCKIRIEARYDGASTDALYMSITDPGESVARSESGYPPINGVLSPGAGGIFESTRQSPVNTEKCYWVTAVRWYSDGAGGSVATFSATIGPVCGTVGTENRLIEPGTVTPPAAPETITFSRIETPSPSGPADLWFDVAIPERLAEGYLCVTPVTPGAAGFLPPREMCTDVSGRDPGTYEVEADGQVDWRGGWAAYLIIPGAESASTTRVWGTPQWVDTWIPG